MLGNKKPRIINVTRKPSKCPDCGSSVVDIIYGTGDMTEIEFVLQYRKDGIMGGTAYLVELQYGAAPVDANASVKSILTALMPL